MTKPTIDQEGRVLQDSTSVALSNRGNGLCDCGCIICTYFFNGPQRRSRFHPHYSPRTPGDARPPEATPKAKTVAYITKIRTALAAVRALAAAGKFETVKDSPTGRTQVWVDDYASFTNFNSRPGSVTVEERDLAEYNWAAIDYGKTEARVAAFAKERVYSGEVLGDSYWGFVSTGDSHVPTWTEDKAKDETNFRRLYQRASRRLWRERRDGRLSVSAVVFYLEAYIPAGTIERETGGVPQSGADEAA